jgi:hypothetical protein
MKQTKELFQDCLKCPTPVEYDSNHGIQRMIDGHDVYAIRSKISMLFMNLLNQDHCD